LASTDPVRTGRDAAIETLTVSGAWPRLRWLFESTRTSHLLKEIFVVKKRVTPQKPVRKARKAASSSRADRSRLDLGPLQKHIRRRIKELESGKQPPAATAARAAESDEETLARLRNALDTLEDICHPTMDIPI
jgi:hypothetical protein